MVVALVLSAEPDEASLTAGAATLAGVVLAVVVVVPFALVVTVCATGAPLGLLALGAGGAFGRHIHILQRFRATGIFARHFHDDVILVQFTVDGGHLPLAEAVVQGIIDILGGQAQTRSAGLSMVTKVSTPFSA
jgi:hypothetical protein